MSEVKIFIKVLDEQVAATLVGCGFCYIKQKINEDQDIYAFEETSELLDALQTLYKNDNFERAVYMRDGALNF